MDWEKRKTIPCVITLIIVMLCNKGYGQESVMSHLCYRSDINHRYAVTWVTAHMKNPSNRSTEIFFKMTLPKTAFISGLIMEVGGLNYTSRVEDKKAAKETYNKAKKRGNHAGLVEQSESAEQKFQVSTNVEARGKVIFYLKYEELLLRSKGEYTQNIQIKPGVKPSKLDVTVHIKESEEIMGLEVVTSPLGPHESNGNDVMASNYNGTHVDIVNPNEAVVRYHSQGPDEGLYGELTLTYDVKRKMDAGEIQVSGGYFVHFFSPDGLPKMAAHTVFILDISGSMSGEKLRQLKQSMLKILNDLQPEDSFELLTFHSVVKSLGVYNAGNPKDMKKAIKKISLLNDQGATNINDALIKGFENVLNRNQSSNQSSANQVVFLTDGEANVGETSLPAILRNIKEINKGGIPLYSLAFGNDADFKFLNKISFNNRGFARQIPVDSNTDKILRGFYQEIGSPLMAEIDIQYPEEAVDIATIVKKGWSTLQSGNEVIVAGQLKPGAIEVLPKIDGIIKTGSHQFKVPRVSNTTQLKQKENFIARLWAYLTIQDLLNTAELTDDAHKVEELNARARSLALKHNFVTKLTSLVVVRPEDLPLEDLPVEDDLTDEEPLNDLNSHVSSMSHSNGGSGFRGSSSSSKSRGSSNSTSSITSSHSKPGIRSSSGSSKSRGSSTSTSSHSIPGIRGSSGSSKSRGSSTSSITSSRSASISRSYYDSQPNYDYEYADYYLPDMLYVVSADDDVMYDATIMSRSSGGLGFRGGSPRRQSAITSSHSRIPVLSSPTLSLSSSGHISQSASITSRSSGGQYSGSSSRIIGGHNIKPSRSYFETTLAPVAPTTAAGTSTAGSTAGSSTTVTATTAAAAAAADQDPHFVLQDSSLNETICFDFHGNDGDILNLIHDNGTGTLVNGKVSASKRKPEKTFFTELFLSAFSVNLTTNGKIISITHKMQNLQQNNTKNQQKMLINTSCQIGANATCEDIYKWKKNLDLRYGNMSLKIRRKKLHIFMGKEEAHYVVVHSKNKHMSFLGFYIELQKYSTDSTTGLLGEFVWKPTSTVTSSSIIDPVSNRSRANLSTLRGSMKRRYKVSEVNAVFHKRRSMLLKVHVDCLFIPNNGEGLLSDMPSSYKRSCLAC